MKKITLMTLLFAFAFLGTYAQQNDIQRELDAYADSNRSALSLSEQVTQIKANNTFSEPSLVNPFTPAESRMLSGYSVWQNRNPEVDIIPTAGATETFVVAVGDFLYDPGGPGVNYPNCDCITTTTLDGATEVNFTEYELFLNFDWLAIYDGVDTSAPVLWDSGPGGANENVDDLPGMIAANGSSMFSGTSGALTFEFRASAVVDFPGFTAEVTATGGGGGGGVCDGVLPNYTNSASTGNGLPSQDFEAAFDDFDAEAADDFIAPGTAQMASTICQVSIEGTGAGLPTDPANMVVLNIYDDDNGLPGTVIYTESFSGAAVDPDGDGNFTLDLTGSMMLIGGETYWLSAVAEMGFNCCGQWFWTTASDGNGSAYVWQNPGGGFGLGCTTWTDGATCGLSAGPDLMMDIGFNEIPGLLNDECTGAIAVECGETVNGTTTGAAIDDTVAPFCDTGVTSPGVWYVYDDTSGLATDITITMCNGPFDYDTKLSVYTGDCGAPPLTCVVGNDDTCGLLSEVNFTSDGNTTYYILVHGFGGATGDFEFEMSCTILPPPNDMIVNSIDVDEIGFPYTDPFVATLAATTENGNPTGCNIDGAAGVWYNFVPEGNGQATAEIVSPAGVSSVQFFSAPDENAVETDLELVPGGQNQCVPGTSATINTQLGQAYYVFVVNTGGPTDITIDGTNLGVGDQVIQGFNYYPNPVSNVLELNSKDVIEAVEVFNILGQKVMNVTIDATQSQIDMSGLQTGTYIMKASVNGQVGTYKIIKK